MLRSIHLLALLLSTLGVASGAHLTYMKTVLSGADYDPAQTGDNVGSGYATATLDTTSKVLTYKVSFMAKGGQASAVHIHGFGAAKANAGVLHTIAGDAAAAAVQPLTGTYSYGGETNAQEIEDMIKAGMTYINVHTPAYPNGEIRGQLMVRDTPMETYSFTLNMDGPSTAQTTQLPKSTGSGSVTIMMNTTANTLMYDATYTFQKTSSEQTGLHIHGYSMPGVDSGVLYNLPTTSGTITYMEIDEVALIDGWTYVQVHSTEFAMGELRGQIKPMGTSGTSAASSLAASLLSVLVALALAAGLLQ